MKDKNLAFKLFAVAAIIFVVITGRAISLTSAQNYIPVDNKAIPPTSTLTPTITFSIISEATSTSTVTPTSTSTSTLTATATETNTPTIASRTPSITGNIQIVTIFYDGDGSREPNEYVEIRNVDNAVICVSGWTLRDNTGHVYTFPYYFMSPGQTCRVYTNEYHSEWCGFNFASEFAIWNNKGDCAYLRDRSFTLIDDYCYQSNKTSQWVYMPFIVKH